MIGAVVFCALVGVQVAAAPQGVDDRKVDTKVVVDVNTASADELCTLPGIGPKKALAIIALRQKKPFTRLTQLLQVKGIGPKTLEKLKPYLRLSAPTPAPTPTSPTSQWPPLAPLQLPAG